MVNDRNTLKIDLLQCAILFYLFTAFFCWSSGEILMKTSRVILFTTWVITILKHRIIAIQKPRYYYIWIILFTIYFFLISITIAFNRNSSLRFLMSSLYIMVIDGIILWYLIQNTDFVYKILSYIPVFALLEGFRLYLTYGFTCYFNTRTSGVNANVPAYIFTIGALIAIYVFINEKQRLSVRFLYGIIAIIDICFVILTASRTAILVNLPVPILFYIVLQSRNPLKVLRNIIIALILAVLATIAVTEVPILYNLVGERIISMVSGLMGGATDSSTSTRMRLIQNGILWFRENPIFGKGLNGYSSINIYLNPNGHGYYAHNNFIEILVDGGIIGFVIYYSIYIVILISGFKNKFWKSRKNVYFMGIFIALIISEIGKVTYFSVVPQFMIMLSYFFLCILPEREKNENNNISCDIYQEKLIENKIHNAVRFNEISHIP